MAMREAGQTTSATKPAGMIIELTSGQVADARNRN
jgi:uncharacterized protein YwbE